MVEEARSAGSCHLAGCRRLEYFLRLRKGSNDESRFAHSDGVDVHAGGADSHGIRPEDQWECGYLRTKPWDQRESVVGIGAAGFWTHHVCDGSTRSKEDRERTCYGATR